MQGKISDHSERRTRFEFSIEHAILESPILAIKVVDRQGQIVFANPGARQILEIDDKPTVTWSQSPQWQILDWDGNLIEDAGLPYHQVIKHGATISDYRYAIFSPDGRQKFISSHGMRIVDQHGESFALFSIQDLTELASLIEEGILFFVHSLQEK